jgi:CBS domain containing-hemolysin-like protein
MNTAGSSNPGEDRQGMPWPGQVRKFISLCLLGVSLLLLITGFGITEPGIITPLTGGLLEKSTAFRIHTWLWGPFLILLILHVWRSSLVPRRWK